MRLPKHSDRKRVQVISHESATKPEKTASASISGRLSIRPSGVPAAFEAGSSAAGSVAGGKKRLLSRAAVKMRALIAVAIAPARMQPT